MKPKQKESPNELVIAVQNALNCCWKKKESPNELVIAVQNALNCCWDNINQYVLLHVVDNIYIFQ